MAKIFGLISLLIFFSACTGHQGGETGETTGSGIQNPQKPNVDGVGFGGILNPVITGFVQSTRPNLNGVLVTIQGSNFVAGTTITINGIHYEQVTVVDANTITLVIGSEIVGNVELVAINPDGSKGVYQESSVLPPPQIAAINPSSVTTNGGDAITVNGLNFQLNVSVLVGGTICPVTSSAPNRITCTSSAKAAGSYDVVVTNLDDAQFASAPLGVIYVAAPASPSAPSVSAILPLSGPVSGGTSVTLTGANFVAGATVSFCSGVNVTSATSLTCTTLSHAAGSVGLSVTNPDTQTSGAVFYTFNPPPALSGISPNIGSTAGNTPITLTGSNFLLGVIVKFGATQNCSNIVRLNSSTITCNTPAHSLGVQSVTVQNSDGQESSSLPFTYQLPAPTLTQISPATGIGGIDNTVTFTGTGLVSGATIMVGANACLNTAFQSALSMTCNPVGHQPPGVVSVTVTNPDGQPATLTNAFTYIADPPPDSWFPITNTNAPSARRLASSVWTGSEMIIWGGWDSQATATGVKYDPASDSFTAISNVSAPSPRYAHVAIWTGSTMVVWSGTDGSNYYNDGGRYDTALNTWTPVDTTGAPSARMEARAVWTGSQMMVMGGKTILTPATIFNSGGLYDPRTNTWSATNTVGAPTGRYEHSMIWTGSLALIWGGTGWNGPNADGGRYNPATNTWSAMSNSIPVGFSSRYNHSAVWTGSQMIVWSGATSSSHPNDGARYNPNTNQWTAISTINAPQGRALHSAVWTGNRMLVFGGTDGNYFNSGGLYDPANDVWAAISTTNSPSPRNFQVAEWTGHQLLVWGGMNSDGNLNTGAVYTPPNDPAGLTYTAISTLNAPSLSEHQAVWTGSQMIAWGNASTTIGGRYDPITDIWTPTSTTNVPTARAGHTMVWTGSKAIVWGGGSNTGSRYDPVGDSWTATTTTGAPTARSYHSAVWTGREMIIWGGGFNTGAKYDPAINIWTPLSTSSAPVARSYGTAVWTGREMIVWGGGNPSLTTFTNSGGKYNPATNIWSAIDSVNAPSARSGHTAVWTGSRMIVWGGIGAGNSLMGGGKSYDPTNDSWALLPSQNAPSPRYRHTSVWTGRYMIVYGGYDGTFGGLGAGASYEPSTNTWHESYDGGFGTQRDLHSAVWTGDVMIVFGGTYPNTGGKYRP